MGTLPRTKVLLALTLVILLSLAGCARAVPAPTPAPTPAPKPTPAPTPKGPYGKLSQAISGSGSVTFDPVKAVTGGGNKAIFDFMFRLDDKGALAPGVVEKWELAPDGRSWLYSIRKGIKFHNGEDLTADDVKFTLDKYISTEVVIRDFMTMVERIEKVDDYTVRIYTRGPQPYLPYVTSHYSPAQGAVIPKGYYERVGAEYFNRHPVGSGSFKFVRDVPGDVTEYEAFDQHWRQVPAFKTVEEIAMPELTTRKAALKTGVVDIIDIDLDSADELEAAGFSLLKLLSEQSSVILYGVYDPQAAGMPTADIRVRQALSLAINRNEINETLFRGRYDPNLPAWIYLISADVDHAYWREYVAKAYRYDLEEAKRLLKEAGYPQGFTITLLSWERGRATQLPKIMEIIQGYWGRIGVKAELMPVDSGVNLLYKGINNRYGPLIGHASPWGCQSSPIPPLRMRTGFHSTGGLALLSRGRPDVDKLLDEARSEMDTARRRELIAKAIKETVDSYTALTLNSLPGLVAVAPRVDLDIPPGICASIIPYLAEAKHK